MKKICISALFALSCACLAHAAPSWAALYVDAYAKGDASPSAANRAKYVAYYCTTEAAQAMFNGASDVKGISSYLAAHLSSGKSAMGTTEGSYALSNGTYEMDEYSFVSYYDNPIADGTYLGVAFFEDSAYRVISSADVESGNLTIETDTALADSGWQSVPEGDAPEPASGLLLALGAAGLALKRRRLARD